jgi:signal transduction histidine kinase
VKLRTKFQWLIGSTFLALALVLSALLLHWTDRWMIDRVSARMEQHIHTAWRALEEQRERLALAARLLARRPDLVDDTRLSPSAFWGLDLSVAPGEAPGPAAEWILRQARAVSPTGAVSGVAAAPPAVMRREAPDLSRRRLADGREADTLILFAAAPAADESGRYALAARVLNRAPDLVESVQRDLFGQTRYEGRRVGTVTVFSVPVRVATTVQLPDGRPAIGTVVSDEVEDRVLGRGEPWTGRAFVVDAWYLSRYDPMRDPSGRVIGMLYIGELEALYRDARLRTVLTGLAAIALVMGAALWVSLWIARRMLQQIADLERASEAFAAGDYGARAPERSRDEIGRFAGSFNRMAATLEEDRARILEQQHAIQEANRNYIDLLSFVTHELRSSLSSAQLNVQLLKTGDYGPLQGDQAEGLDLVARTLKRLNDVTLNYLQLSRIEEGHRMIARSETFVKRDAIDPVLDDLAPSLRQAGMRAEVDVPEDLVVAADVTLIRIVFQNLVGNAIQYGFRDSVVDVRADPGDGQVTFRVCNRGPGIPADKRAEVFQKFRHFDVDDDRGRSGTGVGLFIVKQIIEQHGGAVWVESEPGGTTCFIFTLLH